MHLTENTAFVIRWLRARLPSNPPVQNQAVGLALEESHQCSGHPALAPHKIHSGLCWGEAHQGNCARMLLLRHEGL